MSPRPRAGGPGSAGAGDPREELDPVAALARMVERVQRAQAIQGELLRGLAGDVTKLIATTPAKQPPPVAWLLTTHPETCLEVLTDLLAWLRDVYLMYPGAVLPSCWMWHPACIEELVCLRQYHAEAYGPPAKGVAKAQEFHERFLPGTVKRLSGTPYSDCDLARHQPTGDRLRTQPDPAPLHDSARQIATAWMDQRIPEPTQMNLSDAKAADTSNTKRRKTQ
ncbi:MAG: hypothetical protein ACRDUW_28975 [Pseudonocardiaceae bacterium]